MWPAARAGGAPGGPADRGRHLVPGREQRRTRVAVPHPVSADDPRRRAAWNDPKLPFLFVQLPNFGDKAARPPLGEGGWAELREAQALALREAKTAMAVTLDIGDAGDIHPREKQEVGRRALALAALKLVYAREIIASRADVRGRAA